MDFLALHSPQYPLNPKICFLVSSNVRKYPYTGSSFSFLLPVFSHRLRLRGNLSIVAAAAKKENSKNDNKRKKDDGHSFVSRSDEATGPYPEALLLKQRNVEENGRLMPEFADVEERELFEVLNLQLESDMGVEQMRHYEVVYLIHEDHKEEVENVNLKVHDFIKEKKGRIWRFSDWGMRKLAYKIQKAKNAHYILTNFEVEAKWINDFKTMLDKDERVIRHLVMKQDKAETWDCPPPSEFHTLHGEMNDDEYLDDDDEDWDDEDGEIDGVIYVDNDDDDEEMGSSSEKNKQEVVKVGR